MSKRREKAKPAGSWEGVSRWYDDIVGGKGHYYHRQVILPNVRRLLKDSGNIPGRLLDLACGQGVLARYLGDQVDYVGVDISSSLIKSAKGQSQGEHYLVGDVTQPLKLDSGSFDCAVCLLAIQDMEHADKMIGHAAAYLKPGGTLLIVMNHPCFRIPRATSWQEESGIRYRRVNGYLKPRHIPIKAEPSKGDKSPIVTSYHRPLSTYFSWLHEAGFAVENLEEWVSDKESTGPKARMENRAREEFPLFLCLAARKSR